MASELLPPLVYYDEVRNVPTKELEYSPGQEYDAPTYTVPEYLRSWPKERLNSFGLPFEKVLAANLDKLKHRVFVENKAVLIALDGGLGSGKTTAAIQMACYLQGSPIDLEKQVAMGGEQFMKKADICTEEKLSVLVYDEAGDFSKRGSLSKFNAQLVRFFETYRAFKIIIIVVLPDFSELDNRIFKIKVLRLYLHLYGKVQGKYVNFSAFGLRRVNFILMALKKGKYVLPDPIIQGQEPNFRGHINELPADISAELDRISTESKRNIKRAARLQMSGLISVADITGKLGKSQPWVAHTLRDLGIEPQEIVGKRFYYKQEVVQTLAKVVKRQPPKRAA